MFEFGIGIIKTLTRHHRDAKHEFGEQVLRVRLSRLSKHPDCIGKFLCTDQFDTACQPLTSLNMRGGAPACECFLNFFDDTRIRTNETVRKLDRLASPVVTGGKS